MRDSKPSLRVIVASLVAFGLLPAFGCTASPVTQTSKSATSVQSSASPQPRPFTVAATGAVRTLDPVSATTESESILIAAIYQRLMQIDADGKLLPDAATDCLFTKQEVYECTLGADNVFPNQNLLTSSDVAFSIQRALRMDAPGADLLDALEQIEIPDESTIRFRLAFEDNQFGYALASLAASIVDENTFDPDQVMAFPQLPSGSGPYQVAEITETIKLQANAKYAGDSAAKIPELVWMPVADSMAAEEQFMQGNVDLVWHSMDSAALDRLETVTDDAKYQKPEWTRTRLNTLQWNPASKRRANSTLRLGVALALQADRTLSSLLPVQKEGHLAVFSLGGRTKLPKVAQRRITLKLGYDPSSPGQGDLARLLRDRIEQLDQVSVRVVPNYDADLLLKDELPYIDTEYGWLYSYLKYPLPSRSEEMANLGMKLRTSSQEERITALETIQRESARDLTILPISLAAADIVARDKISVDAAGSSGQLGLWGISNG